MAEETLVEEEILAEETLATLEEETQVAATSRLQLCQLTRSSFDMVGKGPRPFPTISLTPEAS
ncbi:hypothetical protein KSC_095760 [Ktedonobacter sp. SOSP1-52]|nr:hypothetical protein KSC_095760 [Ktedonobacter sp. SOSP1-52]